jgi:hypothetical protein
MIILLVTNIPKFIIYKGWLVVGGKLWPEPDQRLLVVPEWSALVMDSCGDVYDSR